MSTNGLYWCVNMPLTAFFIICIFSDNVKIRVHACRTLVNEPYYSAQRNYCNLKQVGLYITSHRFRLNVHRLFHLLEHI